MKKVTKITKSELRKMIKESIVEQRARRWNRDYEENDEDSNDEEVRCSECGGTGEGSREGKRCGLCKGRGSIHRYMVEQAAAASVDFGSPKNRPQPGDIYVAASDYHPMFFKVIDIAKQTKYGVIYQLAKIAAKAERGVFTPDPKGELGSRINKTYHTGQKAFEIGGDVGVATKWDGRPVKAPGYFREQNEDEAFTSGKEELNERFGQPDEGAAAPQVGAPKMGDIFSDGSRFYKVSQKYKSHRSGDESYMLAPLATDRGPNGVTPKLNSFKGAPLKAVFDRKSKSFSVEDGAKVSPWSGGKTHNDVYAEQRFVSGDLFGPGQGWEENDDERDCAECKGTGDGRIRGTVCGACRGTGVEPRFEMSERVKKPQHVDADSDDDEEDCSKCGGSGEGSREGKRCGACGGSGVTQRYMRESMISGNTEPAKVGDIYVSNWGYEQTNIDFYKVVRLIGKASVEIVKLGKVYLKQKPGEEYQVPVMPNIDDVRSAGVKKRIDPRGSIKITTYSRAYPWDGKPELETASGYGH